MKGAWVVMVLGAAEPVAHRAHGGGGFAIQDGLLQSAMGLQQMIDLRMDIEVGAFPKQLMQPSADQEWRLASLNPLEDRNLLK